MVFKKGIKFSEEHRRNISIALKKAFKEGRRDISKERNPFFGKRHSEKTKLILSNKNKGKIPWQKQLGDNHPKVIEYRKKLKETGGKQNIGRTPWNYRLTKKDNPDKIKYGLFGDKNPVRRAEIRKKISEKNKGKLMGDLNPAKREENRIKITLGLIKAFKEGRKIPLSKEKNPMWKGGLSFEPYTTDWTNTLKKFIRERDNYTCQLCNNLQWNKTLAVHHIDYNKKNCNPENLITLCKKCHSKTNAKREKWKEMLTKKSIKRQN